MYSIVSQHKQTETDKKYCRSTGNYDSSRGEGREPATSIAAQPWLITV